MYGERPWVTRTPIGCGHELPTSVAGLRGFGVLAWRTVSAGRRDGVAPAPRSAAEPRRTARCPDRGRDGGLRPRDLRHRLQADRVDRVLVGTHVRVRSGRGDPGALSMAGPVRAGAGQDDRVRLLLGCVRRDAGGAVYQHRRGAPDGG